jgi:hypothetical protein
LKRWTWCVLLLAACGKKGGTGTPCAGAFLAGDLVISEVMPNPAGDDTGKEWFEVYNAGTTPADIGGLELVTSLPDKTSEKAVAVTSGTIPAGAYFVFSASAPDLLPDYADYGYGNALGSLRNDTGRIALRCGDVIVDEVTYANVTEGAAREFTGAQVPDSVANEDPTKWCDGQTEYETGDKGTPGAANDSCGAVGTKCDDGGTMRDILFPTVGDVVISEIMPDPTKVADDQGEWFELTIVHDVDLNGLQIGATPGMPKTTIADSACRRRVAGSRVVFARSDAAGMNGMLPAVEATFGFGLSNSGGSLYVGVNGTTLDQVSWAAASAGTSIQLDRDKIDPDLNDNNTNWCGATATYGLGDKGTPGGENASCPVVVPDGMCVDGTTLRAIVTPAVGDLIIDELLPDLDGADTDKEWFEVLVRKDVDLNGLQIGTTFPTVQKTFTAPECLRATTGTFLLFLHNDGSGTNPNGGLPKVDFRFGFDLVNSNRGIFIGVGGTLVDAVTYTTVPAGASRVLKTGKVGADPTTTDAVNDDATWCTSTAVYDAPLADKGTPGAADATCP